MLRPLLSTLALLVLPSAAAAVTVATSDDLAPIARALVPGERLRLVGALEAGAAGELALELERRQTVTPEARLLVHGDGGRVEARPLPATVHLAGAVEGRAGSRVALAVRENGELRALLLDGAGFATARAGAGQPLVFRRVAAAAGPEPGFACGAEGLFGPDGEVDDFLPLVAGAEAPTAITHTARVAVETDYEYYQLFGSVAPASEYALDLLAFSSTIYEAELETGLAVESVSLWTSASDPWQQSSPSCGFYEFGDYWNRNRTEVSRTVAHFLSGKNNGGGIAWVGVLCSGPFNASTGGTCPPLAASGLYGGAYGYTGSIDGDFDPGSPAPVWDIIAVSHEIGHNFASPHTHCYANYGGNPAHVDQCWNSTSTGCYSGTTKTLPGLGSVTGGTPGAGNGTIMSYCHLLSGGYDNIELTFGLGHPYGVAADRVPSRMAAHVAARAAAYPTCLAPIVPGEIFRDDFELGSFSRWDSRS